MERRSPAGTIRIEDLLDSAARDAAEYGCAYFGPDSLGAMARAARTLREDLRRTRVRLHVLADEAAEAGITVDTDFLPADSARVGCQQSAPGCGPEEPAS